jgi:DNA-binding response OmpR family regulator
MMIIRSDDRTSTILVVDDNEINRDILVTRLASQGYDTLQAVDGEQALAMVSRTTPDLILLDIMMPKIDGLQNLPSPQGDRDFVHSDHPGYGQGRVGGMSLPGWMPGADEYLVKPIDQAALVARVRSALRMKSLHDEGASTGGRHLATLNALSKRVAKQVAEIERVGRLRRFLSPGSCGTRPFRRGETLLQSHRQRGDRCVL